ncbi:predicted protein [Thalassiosira pseudonana CCMP1335]|uniref:Protein kinase domain-containing protein n=1 Tax=Thalassiosira pseudonana TaxID=35128 RepID=B8LC46_THAPS|nr:predicted protein [Thalassiosira pseudonana CCMP1335]EED87153.1 predicted protein [Thalassiosira pseudonana CCMP1335]
MMQRWKEQLLSETLFSLIRLQQQMQSVKSLTNGYNDDNGKTLSNLIHQTLGIDFNTATTNRNINNINNSITQLISKTIHLNTTAITLCEAPSFREQYNAKQATLDQYNALPSSKLADKPSEWNDDNDLQKRRLEFGKEISPLSNTTRLERWGMACKRMVTLGVLAAPLGVLVPFNWVLGNMAGKKGIVEKDEQSSDDGAASAAPVLSRYHQNLTQATWDYALWAIETAGPTYIKLVQWASTRNDLFSPEFVGHFSKLQDETRGHNWKDTEVALVRAFGKDWKNVLSFDRIIEDDESDVEGGENRRLKGKGGLANRERQKRLEKSESASSSSAGMPTIPIGSGCVAQVYKARLRSSYGLHPAGTSVAVKVQHPHILEKVCLDFYLMNKFAAFLEFIPYLNLDYLSMKDSVDQFRDIMLPQLDLRVEAHNLQRFRRDFEGESQIAFPEPLMDLTSREVLVERFVEGEPMLNFVLKEDAHHSKKDREELARIGLEAVMKMIFLHDFIHADLHPGNMIVDRNQSARGKPLRVNMIDCGLTVELGEQDHMNLVKILGSLIKRDGYGAGKLMVDTAKKCQSTELDVEMFCNGIQKICEDDEENNFLESVGDYITDICYLACKHKVKLEAAFINAALACEIMEGLAASLYPDMHVQQVALPMVLKAEMMHGLKGLPTARLWGGK